MNYYYLAASLPFLKHEDDPPFSVEDFLTRCHSLMHDEDYADLTHTARETTHHAVTPIGREWHVIETQIRNQLVAYRAHKYRVNAQDYIRSYPGFSEATRVRVEQALELQNPREREWALDDIRWTMAGDLASHHPFDFARILAFVVQLRILERWRILCPDAGRERANRLLRDLADAALGKALEVG